MYRGRLVLRNPESLNWLVYMPGFKGHNGCDLRCAMGTPLYSPCEGYAHFGDEGKIGYGKFVKITSLPYMSDGTRREVTLGHMSRPLNQLEGQFVHAGDLIGYSGATGDATGPHVHITYKKLNAQGAIMDSSNGYNGAIDVTSNILLWLHSIS